MMPIFIRGNVPSSKNSRIWSSKCNRSIESKATRSYKKNSEEYWDRGRAVFKSALEGKEKPYRVGFKFIRKKKKDEDRCRNRFDYVNPLQTVQDEMVRHGWLEDDNADVLLPVLEQYEFDLDDDKLGVYIEVL